MARICMVVISHYPDDPRPRREAEALIEAGHEVDIICLRKKGQPPTENIRGVMAYRLPVHRKRAGKLRYIIDYLNFMVRAAMKLSILHIKRHYRLIHIHNMPDVLVFSALIPRLGGCRILLDLHDPTPEVYQTKFGLNPKGRGFRLLSFLEQISIRFSHAVITPNTTFRNLFIARGCPENKIGIVMNSPQETIFLADKIRPDKLESNKNKEFIVMFHGGLYERHGIDTALQAMALIRHKIPGLRFHVFGDGDFRNDFIAMIDQLNLGDIVTYFGSVPLERIAGEIPRATVGLIPNKRTPFTEINFPTRIFEYLCLNRAVIAPATTGILDYFHRSDLFFFEPGNACNLADALITAWKKPTLRDCVVHRGQLIYHQHTWFKERQRLVSTVNKLMRNNRIGNIDAILNQNR